MLRAIKIGAIVALANVVGARSVGAQSLTWGIFRENAASVSESQRNCWSQAMVSGQTINGDVLEQNLTEQKAESELRKFANRGLCAAERTSPSWTARDHERGDRDANDGWPSSGGSNGR